MVKIMTQQQFGLIGLGVMGQNLALNMERNGVYDRSATVRQKFASVLVQQGGNNSTVCRNRFSG